MRITSINAVSANNKNNNKQNFGSIKGLNTLNKEALDLFNGYVLRRVGGDIVGNELVRAVENSEGIHLVVRECPKSTKNTFLSMAVTFDKATFSLKNGFLQRNKSSQRTQIGDAFLGVEDGKLVELTPKEFERLIQEQKNAAAPRNSKKSIKTPTTPLGMVCSKSFVDTENPNHSVAENMMRQFIDGVNTVFPELKHAAVSTIQRLGR